jgi:hypothetical protein
MTLEDIAAEDSDDEHVQPTSKGNATGIASGASEPPPTGIHKFSRKLKDKITGQTHEEYVQIHEIHTESVLTLVF